MPGRPRAVAVVAACLVALAGCAENDEPATPDTALFGALATVDAPEPVGAGIGWIDVPVLRKAGGTGALRSAGPALGPGGGDLFDELRPKLAQLGADPYQSEGALSVNASFTFGVRLQGVDPTRIAQVARKDGERRPVEAEGWKPYDLAGSGVLPDSELQEAADALSSHVAIADDSVVFARAAQARGDLTLPESPGSEAPSLILASECLGDVAAARIVPNNFTYLSGIGPDLFVMGMRAPSGAKDPGEEILCGIDTDREEIDRAAVALADRLQPDAIDVTTDEPVRRVFSSVDVDTLAGEGNYAARAVLTMADGAEPGAVFRSFDVGSAETFFGLQGPGSNSLVPAE